MSTEFDQTQEEAHVRRVICAMRSYARSSVLCEKESKAVYLTVLSESQRALLGGKGAPDDPWMMAYDRLKTVMAVNQTFLNKICELHDMVFQADSTYNLSADRLEAQQGDAKPSSEDMRRVFTTLRQFARDWSAYGEREREQCYGPIKATLQELYPSRELRKDVKVLVPGAGLGRLAYDLAHMGFSSEGNEFSYFMLLSSSFVMNRSDGANSFHIYPFLNTHSNVFDSADRLQRVSVPDIDPTAVPDGFDLAMVAGDFLEVYTTPDTWDCFASAFFLDTAHNPLEYLEAIYKILKPGGVFINFGPLQYHFENVPGEMSFELSYDHIRLAMVNLGFEFVNERYPLSATYVQNNASMLQTHYECVFFVARKPK